MQVSNQDVADALRVVEQLAEAAAPIATGFSPLAGVVVGAIGATAGVLSKLAAGGLAPSEAIEAWRDMDADFLQARARVNAEMRRRAGL